MFTITTDESCAELEGRLQIAFGTMDLIGQLALDKDSFSNLCEIIQREGGNSSRWNVRGLPSAVFLTSMVFWVVSDFRTWLGKGLDIGYGNHHLGERR